MIANSNAKNTGATNANSTAADPRRLRRKHRNALLMGTLDATGEDIEETPGGSNILQAQDYPKLIVEVFRPIKTD